MNYVGKIVARPLLYTYVAVLMVYVFIQEQQQQQHNQKDDNKMWEEKK